MARARRVLAVLATLLLLCAPGLMASPVSAATGPFTDIAGSTFKADIEWLYAEGITTGCTPTKYCPDASVTRGQMASFLVRMFKLPSTDIDFFVDDEDSIHEADINRLAASGITTGCTATEYCPKDPVRRDQMASFLVRAIPISIGQGRNYFRDDDDNIHEPNIDRAATAGIASGCGPWRYCPGLAVKRGQMAAFLHRVVEPLGSALPYPAPSGGLTLHVATNGNNTANTCFDTAAPCRTLRYALAGATDGDTISIGAGTFGEEGLIVVTDLTITGDPGGGTTIDATGGGRERIFTIIGAATVSLEHLTLAGAQGSAGPIYAHGGAVYNDNFSHLIISDSTIRGNTSESHAGAIYNNAVLLVTRTTIEGNRAVMGGAVTNWGGFVTIADSTISANTADEHGGVLNTGGGTLIVTNSTISRNVGYYSGGVSNYASATIVNSTISGNTGGIFDFNATLTLKSALVVGNSKVGPWWEGDLSGSVDTRLASIVGIPVGLTLADILDPAGLADNGGPTRTIALIDSATNPALDKGDAATCAAAPVDGLDQRGLTRTPPCDIGAYEIQP